MGTLKVTIVVGDSQGRQFEELDSRSTSPQPTPQFPERCSRGWGSRSKGRYPPRLPTAESSPST